MRNLLAAVGVTTLVLVLLGGIKPGTIDGDVNATGDWDFQADLDVTGALKLGGVAVTPTAAELNILDTVTATAAQLNVLNGGAVLDHVIFCGEADENGTVYLGPSTAQWGGSGADLSIGGAACDALENPTEGSADAPLLGDVAFKILGGICVTDGTLGSGESVVFTFRSAEADTTPQQTCTIAEGESDCSLTTATTTDVAAGATVATQAVQSSDNTDDNLWCRATIAYQ